MTDLNVLEIKNLKKKKRQAVKEKQAGLLREYIKYADEKICCNILSLPEYQNAKAVFCFIGTKDEINTKPLLEEILKSGKKLLVPKCRDASEKHENKGIMDAFEITSLFQLEKGSYGILEPLSECRLADPKEIDLAVIPCLSCNEQGYRLGHGGGYYDRFLENQNFTTAVICRKQLFMPIPIESTDQKMDYVVSEEGIINVKNS